MATQLHGGAFLEDIFVRMHEHADVSFDDHLDDDSLRFADAVSDGANVFAGVDGIQMSDADKVVSLVFYSLGFE